MICPEDSGKPANAITFRRDDATAIPIPDLPKHDPFNAASGCDPCLAHRPWSDQRRRYHQGHLRGAEHGLARDLRKVLIDLDPEKLATTIKVTFPVGQITRQVLFFVRDEHTALLARELFSRIVPPWSWQVSADHAEADRWIAEHFPAAGVRPGGST